MFSQKYKDEVVEDLFQSMKQLDRIEFKTTVLQQTQSYNLLKTIQSTFLIINFISISFLIYFSGTFMHLLSLGLYSEIHRQAGIFFFFIFVVTSILILCIFLQSISLSDKFKKENDEQLDFILNK